MTTIEKQLKIGIIKILSNHGKSLHAGEEIRYIITNFYSKNHLERALPVELVTDQLTFSYDVKRYCNMLSNIYNSITKYFYK